MRINNELNKYCEEPLIFRRRYRIPFAELAGGIPSVSGSNRGANLMRSAMTPSRTWLTNVGLEMIGSMDALADRKHGMCGGDIVRTWVFQLDPIPAPMWHHWLKIQTCNIIMDFVGYAQFTSRAPDQQNRRAASITLLANKCSCNISDQVNTH